MKLFWKVLVLGALLTTGSGSDSFAQDKQLLARVAYEEAERAFDAGKLSTAYEELKKVDEHLGKVMPKTQFLRVQIWKTWADEDGKYLESAIWNSKTYLAMDKTFDLPEEKKLEVTRWLVQLEKDKVAYDKAEKENAVRKAKAVAFIDSLYKVCDYKPDLTEKEFAAYIAPRIKQFKRNTTKSLENQPYVYYDLKPLVNEVGAEDVVFKNDSVFSYYYVIDFHETDIKGMRAKFEALVKHVTPLFPPKNISIAEDCVGFVTIDLPTKRYVSIMYRDYQKKRPNGVPLGIFVEPKILIHIKNTASGY